MLHPSTAKAPSARATPRRISTWKTTANWLKRAAVARTHHDPDPFGASNDVHPSSSTRSSQATLRRLATQLHRARSLLKSMSLKPDGAGSLVAPTARWTVIDSYEHAGQRYVLARAPECYLHQVTALTVREAQIIGYVRLGYHNKAIASELGIAHSTVRVLLARAAAKLGVHGRAQLIDSSKDLATAV